MGQFYGVKTMIPPYGYQLIIKLISNNVMHAVDIVIINSVHVYNLVWIYSPHKEWYYYYYYHALISYSVAKKIQKNPWFLVLFD